MKKVFGIITSGLGVVSSMAGILGSPDNIQRICWSALIIISIIAFLYLISTSIRNFFKQCIGPSGDILNACFKIRAADETDIRWIAGLQRSIYSGNDAVPLDVLMEWYHVFPNGFFVIEDRGNPIGHIDILPIKESTLQKYKNGQIIEKEIRGDCLYSPLDKLEITDIYIESLIIKSSKLRQFALRELMRNFSCIINRVGNPDKIQRISAMAATRDGEKFLEHWGFQIISENTERKDGHKMYETKFQPFFQKVLKIYHVQNST